MAVPMGIMVACGILFSGGSVCSRVRELVGRIAGWISKPMVLCRRSNDSLLRSLLSSFLLFDSSSILFSLLMGLSFSIPPES
jgi:hypothetical protein